ncbi:ArsR/SmtB family transcription factor [Rhizobium sp. A37_96]
MHQDDVTAAYQPITLQFLECNTERAVSLLAALSNAKRLEILVSLIDQEYSVGALAKRVSLSQSALSRHLILLKNGALVTSRRHRQTIYYTCQSAIVHRLLAVLSEVVMQ